ncbi:3,4-dihydroxy-2-butanone-4-phosphate synthase [Phenylobacterium sp.]|jgi:3,4-dihydroxy 2-butanone 4-phosphate synthase/GTP cyclohydrolase II|uniref:3,4-dihydroxy-2-butanone-4-phosphate synthase n=1 Tax=Phenylobacterium sp. TaxID=1871053 RepID=UPI002F40DD42
MQDGSGASTADGGPGPAPGDEIIWRSGGPAGGVTSSAREALSSPEEIIEEARAGRMFILVDDEDRENEGDLIIPAQMATPEAINFMARHARGLICLALTEERVRELGLVAMSQRNEAPLQTAFTVSIEAREGVTTGISAADRARTIQVAIDPACGAADIVSPGHIFPLTARTGGVLVRTGHTEASVDIARLAGLNPAGVICEIMNDDGSMARLPDLVQFSQLHGIKIGAIADLVAYRCRHDTLIRCVREYRFESDYGGEWRARLYANHSEGTEHLALVKGEISPDKPALVRVHTMSFLDDALGRTGPRAHLLQNCMRIISEAGGGAIILLRHSHGASLNDWIGDPPWNAAAPGGRLTREYGVGAQILRDLGVRDMTLLSNSAKHRLAGLEGYGLRICEERPIGD